MLSLIGNIIWLILFGWWIGLTWAFFGVFLCLTIIGIPFGIQCFKLATLAFFPFGTTIVIHFERYPIVNSLWAIFFGIPCMMEYLISGLFLFITIIGIPFSKQCMKLAILSLFPFGADLE